MRFYFKMSKKKQSLFLNPKNEQIPYNNSHLVNVESTQPEASFLVGGWTNPFLKICSSNWIISPGRGENTKYLSCHHLVLLNFLLNESSEREKNIEIHFTKPTLTAPPKKNQRLVHLKPVKPSVSLVEGVFRSCLHPIFPGRVHCFIPFIFC